MLFCFYAILLYATFKDSIHKSAIPDSYKFSVNFSRLNNSMNEADFLFFIFSLPARNCDLHFGGGDVPRQRVELVDRSHVLEFVHDVSLH